jgi:hypothetical protein
MRQSFVTHSKQSPEALKKNSKSMNVNTLLELHSLAKTHCNDKKEKQPYSG